MTDLGARLKDARKRAKKTQDEVSGALGLGAGVLTAYETGKSGISDERLVQLANLYGVDPEDLAGRPVSTGREDAFYDGILHALATFNRASGELIAEVQAWRERQSGRTTGPLPPPVSREVLDATGQRQLAADAAATGRRRRKAAG